MSIHGEECKSDLVSGCVFAGDFFEPPPDHNNTGVPPAHTVTTGFI